MNEHGGEHVGTRVGEFIFKMPDLGEGTVEAEIVAWHTKPGDVVTEDQIIVEVMTDKAAVEVPAPVGGRVVSIRGEPGDKIAVGSPLIVFDTAVQIVAGSESGSGSGSGSGAAAALAPAPAAAADVPTVSARVAGPEQTAANSDIGPVRSGRVMASPANRRRAHEAGIDLSTVAGSGPGGRILRGDLMDATALGARAAGTGPGGRILRGDLKDAAALGARAARTPGPAPTAVPPAVTGGGDVSAETSEIKVIGVRRLIAERMSEAKRTIPHFAYVEEIDITELESLRQHLNGGLPKGTPGLTYLPFVIAALTRTLESFPQCNVLYDAARGVLVRHRAVHVGVATQTPDGLKVPVVRHAEALSLWDLATEIRRVAERARSNRATREELVGSTITVTSLGKLGGIASTPVINAPEVAIIGLNKAVERPVVHSGVVVVRRIMNLSSSFDHRFVDGYDAAAMIQALKDLLEHPATIFLPKVTLP